MSMTALRPASMIVIAAPLCFIACASTDSDQWQKIDRAARYDLDRRYPSSASREEIRQATGTPILAGGLDDAARDAFGAWCVERVRERAGDRAISCDVFVVSGGSSGVFEDRVFYDANGRVVAAYRRFAGQ